MTTPPFKVPNQSPQRHRNQDHCTVAFLTKLSKFTEKKKKKKQKKTVFLFSPLFFFSLTLEQSSNPSVFTKKE